jgi:hypothetical protein
MSGEIRTSAEAAEDEVLPRRYEVHSDTARADGEQPIPAAVTQKPLKSKSAAEWAYERLILYIRNFEEQLDNEHEVAMGFAGGEAGVLRIEGMGYFDPDILTFYGTDDEGTRTQLIQHVSQLSVMLQAMPKSAEVDPPRRIGFRLAADLEKS